MAQYNRLFYQNCDGKKLSTKRNYYTCLAKNTVKCSLYILKEKSNTRKYVGKFLRQYITGYGDNSCGHYEFLNNNEIITIHDEYDGSRAFCIYMPLRWEMSNISEQIIFENLPNILNSLLTLTSSLGARGLQKINIKCVSVIMTYFNLQKEMFSNIDDIIERLVFQRRLTI